MKQSMQTPEQKQRRKAQREKRAREKLQHAFQQIALVTERAVWRETCQPPDYDPELTVDQNRDVANNFWRTETRYWHTTLFTHCGDRLTFVVSNDDRDEFFRLQQKLAATPCLKCLTERLGHYGIVFHGHPLVDDYVLTVYKGENARRMLLGAVVENPLLSKFTPEQLAHLQTRLNGFINIAEAAFWLRLEGQSLMGREIGTMYNG
jgi:hypothetical protein